MMRTRRRYDWIVILIAVTALVYYFSSHADSNPEKETATIDGLTEKHDVKLQQMSSNIDPSAINPFIAQTASDNAQIEERRLGEPSQVYDTMPRPVYQSGNTYASNSVQYENIETESASATYGSANNPYRYNNQGEILNEDCPPLYGGGNDYARARLAEMGCLPAE